VIFVVKKAVRLTYAERKRSTTKGTKIAKEAVQSDQSESVVDPESTAGHRLRPSHFL